jgi:hypothetical protein
VRELAHQLRVDVAHPTDEREDRCHELDEHERLDHPLDPHADLLEIRRVR